MQKQILTFLAFIFICFISLQVNAQLSNTFKKESCFTLAYCSKQMVLSESLPNKLAMSLPIMAQADNTGGGKTLVTTGKILAIIGGGMIGWYLGTKLGNEDSEISSGILIGGAVLATTGIILSAIGSKKVKKSLSYNSKYQPSFSLHKNHSGYNAFCLGLKITVK